MAELVTMTERQRLEAQRFREANGGTFNLGELPPWLRQQTPSAPIPGRQPSRSSPAAAPRTPSAAVSSPPSQATEGVSSPPAGAFSPEAVGLAGARQFSQQLNEQLLANWPGLRFSAQQDRQPALQENQRFAPEKGMEQALQLSFTLQVPVPLPNGAVVYQPQALTLRGTVGTWASFLQNGGVDALNQVIQQVAQGDNQTPWPWVLQFSQDAGLTPEGIAARFQQVRAHQQQTPATQPLATVTTQGGRTLQSPDAVGRQVAASGELDANRLNDPNPPSSTLATPLPPTQPEAPPSVGAAAESSPPPTPLPGPAHTGQVRNHALDSLSPTVMAVTADAALTPTNPENALQQELDALPEVDVPFARQRLFEAYHQGQIPAETYDKLAKGYITKADQRLQELGVLSPELLEFPPNAMVGGARSALLSDWDGQALDKAAQDEIRRRFAAIGVTPERLTWTDKQGNTVLIAEHYHAFDFMVWNPDIHANQFLEGMLENVEFYMHPEMGYIHDQYVYGLLAALLNKLSEPATNPVFNGAFRSSGNAQQDEALLQHAYMQSRTAAKAAYRLVDTLMASSLGEEFRQLYPEAIADAAALKAFKTQTRGHETARFTGQGERPIFRTGSSSEAIINGADDPANGSLGLDFVVKRSTEITQQAYYFLLEKLATYPIDAQLGGEVRYEGEIEDTQGQNGEFTPSVVRRLIAARLEAFRDQVAPAIQDVTGVSFVYSPVQADQENASNWNAEQQLQREGRIDSYLQSVAQMGPAEEMLPPPIPSGPVGTGDDLFPYQRMYQYLYP